MKRDAVDRTLQEWTDHAPETDVSGRHVVWRLQMIAKYISQAIADMDELDGQLSSSAVRMLLHLIATPEPHEAHPSALGDRLLLTSGSMTALIDRLEGLGYVSRRRDPSDRRAILVGLTDTGKETARRLSVAHTELEARILQPLDEQQRAELTELLRALVLAYESDGWQFPKG